VRWRGWGEDETAFNGRNAGIAYRHRRVQGDRARAGSRDLDLSRLAHGGRRFAWRVPPGTLAISLLNHPPDRHGLVAVAIERQTFDRRQGEGAGLRVNFVIEYLLRRLVSPFPEDRVPVPEVERRKRKWGFVRRWGRQGRSGSLPGSFAHRRSNS